MNNYKRDKSTDNHYKALEYLFNIISETLNIDLAILKSNNKKVDISSKRIIYYYLARTYLPMTYKEISSYANKSDHTSARYGYHKMLTMIEYQAYDAIYKQAAIDCELVEAKFLEYLKTNNIKVKYDRPNNPVQ